MIILRDDQAALKAGVYNGWAAGNKNMLAVLPTGGGKSIIVSDIVLDNDRQGMKQAVIAHRNELVSQMSLHIARRGVYHKIIGPANIVQQITKEHRSNFEGQSFINPSANCAVGGIDTIKSRQVELQSWMQQVSRWTIDEAHHVLAGNKWGAGVSMFPNAYGLGVTATPQRADGMGLGSHHDGVFDDMVVGPSMRELINIGALTDYEIVVPLTDFQIDESAVTAGGDFSQKKMREASQRSHIVGDVVTEYCKYALGKRTIVFATDVETSNEIARNFKANGIEAASISAKTPSEVRADMVRRFRAGQIKVLVNVDLFGEGFDVPAVEVVIMARPTASLSVYLQQFGRALRTLPGKTHGLIIDMVSNVKRHGYPEKARFWSLDRRDKKAKKEKDPEDIPLTVCLQCTRPYDKPLPACPHCGFVPPLPEPSKRTLEQVDGDLILLDREKLAELRAAMELESPAAVHNKTQFVTGNEMAARGALNRQRERIEAQQALRERIEQWAGIQRHKGRSDQESYRRFYLATGVDVLSALAQPRADMEKMAEMVEGWYGK